MGGHSYHHHHHHHTKRIHYHRGGGGHGGDCGNCNCNCNNPVCIIVLMSIFALVVAWVIVSSVFPKPSTSEITLSLSETRLVTIKSNWHDSFVGGTPIFYDPGTNSSYINRGNVGNDVTLMRFNSRPLLTETDSWKLTEKSVPISAYDHHYWSWYFYKDSTISVTWQYTVDITVYIIRSVKGYDAYYDNTYDQTNYQVQKYTNFQGSLRWTIETDDIYFVVFENWDQDFNAIGGGEFNIKSVLLDVTNPDDSCSLPCTLNVPYQSNNYYVLHTPLVSEYQAQRKGSPNSEFTFNLRKASRVWYVIVIGYVIPLICVVFVAAVILIIIKLCRPKRTLAGSSSTTDIQMTNMAAATPYPPATIIATTPGSPPAPYTPTPYPPGITVAYPTSPGPDPSYPPPTSYPPPQYAPSSDYPPPSQYPPPGVYPSAYPGPPPSHYPPPSQPPSDPMQYPPPGTYPPSPPPPHYTPSSTQYPPADGYTPNPNYPPPPPS